MKIPSSSLLCISGLLALTAPSQAAITSITESFTADATGTAVASHTFTSSLNLTSSNKLVVTVGGEGGNNGSTNNTVTSVTYGGVGLSMIETQPNTGGRRASIWFIDLAGQSFTGTDFVVNYATSQDGIGLGAYALAGTAAGYSAFNQAVGGAQIINSTLQLTTLTDGEFVVGAMARNNFDTGGTGFSGSLQELFYEDLTGSSAASGSFLAGAAGEYNLTIANTSNSTAVFVGASFAAIPEPSALSLIGLGAFGLLMRRRR